MIDWDECKSIRRQMVEMEMERLREELEETRAEQHRERLIRNDSGWYLLRRSEPVDHSDWWGGFLCGVLVSAFAAFLWWAWRVSG